MTQDLSPATDQPVSALGCGSQWVGVPTETAPAAEWDRDVARRAVDELFNLARKYRTTKAYREMLEFVAQFRFYSPFNAMLLHIQKPGAAFVAPPNRWRRQY